MAILAEYHRPKSLPEALELLAERTSHRVPLAGGTHLVGALETRQRRDVDGVVDLAALDLSHIQAVDSSLQVGAMTTLTELVEHPRCADLAGGILPDTARFEGPLNLRNAATVGGLVALAEPDSELYAALLALDTSVVAVDREGAELVCPLVEFARKKFQDAPPLALITEIRVPLGRFAGAHTRIARSPMDRCIVAAVAVAASDREASQPEMTNGNGSGDSVRTALCGVGSHPRLAEGQLAPVEDYKGSADYRLAMAEVVARRAHAVLRGTNR